MYKIIMTAFLVLLTQVCSAYGHGVTYGVSQQHAVAVHFGYAGGVPMSYAETKVFGPESSADVEFQNGRTDAQGFFAFVPNSAGIWQVRTTDNQGHQGTVEVVIEESELGLQVGQGSQEQQEAFSWYKLLFALSIIANLACAARLVKGAK